MALVIIDFEQIWTIITGDTAFIFQIRMAADCPSPSSPQEWNLDSKTACNQKVYYAKWSWNWMALLDILFEQNWTTNT